MKIATKLRSTMRYIAPIGVSLVLVAPGLATAAEVFVDFTNKGTFDTGLYAESGVEVRGSADLHFLDLNGLGIVGGETDTFVDHGESITFTFLGGGAVAVRYGLSAYGNLSGIQFTDSTIEAFGLNGESLGLRNPNIGINPINVSFLFRDAPIGSFRVTSDQDGFRFGYLSYEAYVPAVPEPGTVAFVALGLAALGLRFERRPKVRSPRVVSAWSGWGAPGDKPRSLQYSPVVALGVRSSSGHLCLRFACDEIVTTACVSGVGFGSLGTSAT